MKQLAIATIPLAAVMVTDEAGDCMHDMRRHDNRWVGCADCGISLGPVVLPQALSALSKLTPKLAQEIAVAIRGGAYDWVACQQVGITADCFKKWMRDPRPEFRDFQFLIKCARADARLVAEQKVYQDDPKFWLTRGPGRDKPDEPGWTEATKVEVTGNVAHRHSGNVRHDVKRLENKELDEMERLLAKAQVIDVESESVPDVK